MSSSSANMTVYDGNRVVYGPAKRPIRVTPDGRAGVVYAGAVYPLHVGDRVLLSDEPWSKADCPDFVTAGTAIPYASARPAGGATPGRVKVTRWHLETNRYGHYLVFDGTEAEAERVVERLRQSALGVRRWDSSDRAADDGHHYDWFARLDYEGSRETCWAEVEALLEPSPRPVPTVRLTTGDPLQTSIAEARTVAAEALNTLLQEQLARAESKLAASEVAHDELARRLAASDRRLLQTREHERLVTAELSHTRDELSRLQHLFARQTAGSDATKEHLASLQRQAEENYAHWLSEAADAERLRAELQEVRAELDEVTAKEARAQELLAEVQTESEERQLIGTTHSTRMPTLETFLRRLLPRTDLADDGIEALAEVERPARFVRLLLQLDEGDNVPSVKWKNMPGLQEVTAKIPTGKSSLGRLLWMRCHDRVTVLVHLKQNDNEQEQTAKKFWKWAKVCTHDQPAA